MLPLNHMFLAEFEKLAKTRAAAEWQAAQARGDSGMANDIAAGYGKLKLRPRYLKDVSQGGAEAGVDLMMGAPMGQQLPGGYVARKIYKPNSPLHRGEVTRKVLEQKKEMTDAAQKLAPQHVVGMAGFEQVGKAPGAPRFASYHEYVPKFKDFHQMQERHVGLGISPEATGPLDAMEQNLLNPMARRGMQLNDVMGPAPPGHGVQAARNPTSFGRGRRINAGNVAFVEDSSGKAQAKVMDFLPRIEGQPDLAREFEQRQGARDLLNPLHDHGPNKYDQKGGLAQLRKDVFQGQHAPRPAAPSGFLTPALKKGLLIGGGATLLGGGAYMAHRMRQRSAERQAA